MNVIGMVRQEYNVDEKLIYVMATIIEMHLNYVEQPGITYGPVIRPGLKPIYEFFAKVTILRQAY